MSNKHPWEYKQPAKVTKISKEEFEELIKKSKKKEEQPIEPKTYRMHNGIPHKVVDGKWVPLTRM